MKGTSSIRRLFCLILCFAMALSLMSFTAIADEQLTEEIGVLAAPSLLSITDGMTQAQKDEVIWSVINQLSLDEKVDLLGGTTGTEAAGTSTKNRSAAGGTYTSTHLKELGIPPITLCDGPAGVRMSYKATTWPSPTAIASSWDSNIMKLISTQTGKEAKFYGVDLMLAPGQNILRNPVAGRNFEYYSEDPLLSGNTALEYTKGLQGEGVGVTLKHYAGNEQETNRSSGNVIASERALREIYLKGFQIAVEGGDPWSVMGSYNRLNNTNACSNTWLMTDVLRNDWGFNGFVMSDWGANVDPRMAVIAQMDLSESSLNAAGKTNIKNILNGTASTADKETYKDLTVDALNKCIYNILNIVIKTPTFKGDYGTWGTPYNLVNKETEFYSSQLFEDSNKIAMDTATECMVLLKNDGNILPIATNKKLGMVTSTNLKGRGGFGDNSVTSTSDFDARGGGSAGVYFDPTHPSVLSLDTAMREKFNLVVDTKDIGQAAGQTKTLTYSKTSNRVTGVNLTYTGTWNDTTLADSATSFANSVDYGIMVISRQTGEGSDNTFTGNDSYYLTANEQKALDAYAEKIHAAGKKLIVILNIGAAIDTTYINSKADAILVSWLPGQEGGKAITKVLSGEVNPSGKLTQTFPSKYEYSPSVAAALALKDNGVTRSAGTYSGVATNGGFGTNPVFYDEGVLVGYRWFDTKLTPEQYEEQVSYPFGYGLSYTNFEFSNIKLNKNLFDSNNKDDSITVTVDVKNTGNIEGREVAQMYLSMENYASESRPMKDLRGYVKTKVLKPNESETVSFTINLNDLQYFDDGASATKVLSGTSTGGSNVLPYGQGKGWTATPGSKFKVIVGNTSNNSVLEEKGVNATFKYDRLPILTDITDNMTEAEKDEIIDYVISQLSLDEKVDLLGGTKGSDAAGTSIKNTSAAGGTYTNSHLLALGVPPITLCDGPAGVRMSYKATTWPSPTAIASSWDTNIMKMIATQTGKEAKYYGVDVMLSPGQNILRNPVAGRNFEYYSEDPLLSGNNALEYTKGVQDEGIGVTLKHYAGNEQESSRSNGNVIASERALREIYLKGFQIAVEGGDPWSVMGSYNRLNNTNACSNTWLMTDVLRGDWGFNGFVMSDWGANVDPRMALIAQMDLSESSLNAAGKTNIKNILNGTASAADKETYKELTMEVLDRSIKNILKGIIKTPIFKGEYGAWGKSMNLVQTETSFYNSQLFKDSDQIALDTATECMVLLKNDNNILPIATNKKLGLVTSTNLKGRGGFGDNSVTSTSDFDARGGGSAGVYFDPTHPSVLSLDAAMRAKFNMAVDTKDIGQAAGQTKTLSYTYTSNRVTGVNLTYTGTWNDTTLADSATSFANSVDYGIMVISRQTGEGSDNTFTGNDSYYLTANEQKGLDAYADKLHAAGKKLIVILNVGASIDTSYLNTKADAILVSWLPGQQGGKAITKVLSGEVNPSGKLSQTFPSKYEYSPSVAASLALKNSGITRNPSSYGGVDTNGGFGTNPVFYDENVYVGYRWFDTKLTPAQYKEQVSYPFGYGLSYSKFEFSNIKLSKKVFDKNNPDDSITVSVDVTNTGNVAGKEVAQMYLNMNNYAAEGRPMKDLRGYVKTKLLQPGEKERVKFTINLSDLQYFDDGAALDKILTGTSTGGSNVLPYAQGKGWTVNDGSIFKVIVGNTSDNSVLEASGQSDTFKYGNPDAISLDNITLTTGTSSDTEVTVKAANRTNAPVSGQIIVCSYDIDNVLLGVEFKDISLGANATEDIKVAKVKNTATITAYLWKGINDVVPLSDVISILN